MTELKLLLESPEMATDLIEVIMTLRNAEEKLPNWPDNPFEQICILSEEAGEVVKAALDYHQGTGTLQELKTELMQTAAMCLRTLKNLQKWEQNV